MADQIWAALGDVAHYIEPFCGSCAVLLLRPKWHRRKMETVNDADGHIANVWRALQSDPDAVAPWCDWPVNRADLMARKRRLLREKDSLLQRLDDDGDGSGTANGFGTGSGRDSRSGSGRDFGRDFGTGFGFGSDSGDDSGDGHG